MAGNSKELMKLRHFRKTSYLLVFYYEIFICILFTLKQEALCYISHCMKASDPAIGRLCPCYDSCYYGGQLSSMKDI